MKIVIEKFRFHVRQSRYDLSPRFVLGRVFYVLHRRRFMPEAFQRALYLMSVQGCGFQHETHMKPYFVVGEGEGFIDVGANRGMYTCYMAERCGFVWSFEPNPQTFKELERATRRYGNVKCFPFALGDSVKRLPLHLHYTSGHDSLIYEAVDYAGREVVVEVYPLDSVVERFPLEGRIGLVKIDVEGYEVEVVRGALKTIEKHRPRLIVEMHRPYAERFREIVEMVERYRWRKVYKEKLTNIDYQFHLVGEPGD